MNFIAYNDKIINRSFGEVILKDTFERPIYRRVRKILQNADGSLSNLAYIGVGAVFSSMLFAVTISITNFTTNYSDNLTSSGYTYEVSDTENIRDALVDAWKKLDLDDANNQVDKNYEPKSEEIAIPQIKPVAPEPKVNYPWNEDITVKVKSGDTVAGILQSKNIGINDTNSIVHALSKHYKIRNLRVGQKIDLGLKHVSKEVAKLNKLEIKTGKLSRVEVAPKGDKFASSKINVKTNKQIAHAGGTVNSSFYVAGRDAGIPAPVIMEMMKAYSYDVDFQRDVKTGQKIDVLFEQLVSKENGDVVGSNGLKYAALTLKHGKKVEIYKYTDRKGKTGYYKSNGESVRKALLRNPVHARISSGFGMRMHPILGYSKMHTGIDFAAKSGTPIHAAGDGVIDFSGRKGGYGNYIRIKHNGKYKTAYAHMRAFAKGIRKGKLVKQGQVIGYVGTTGRSTGAHLHYEIIKNGKKINPSGVKFRTGRILKGKELANFKKEKGRLKNQLASLPRIREQVAQANIAKK